jgi:hypothetical protein
MYAVTIESGLSGLFFGKKASAFSEAQEASEAIVSTSGRLPLAIRVSDEALTSAARAT